jgi:hypothetical protein
MEETLTHKELTWKTDMYSKADCEILLFLKGNLALKRMV